MCALFERATERVIDEAIAQNSEPPLATKHVEDALRELRPSTLEWLRRARNYVEFANQDGRYKDVADFLRSKEARSYRDQLV